jgi:DNA-directed RNA polymerase specialized sigma24 family protein
MRNRVLTDHEGYELFRRAIVDGDSEAWAEIYTHFRQLLLSWARLYSTRAPMGDQAEDIADRALSRAWSALSAEHFGRFSGLPALLAYLRTCVAAVAIDSMRAEAARDRAFQKLTMPASLTPEDEVVEEQGRAELWELLSSLVPNEYEWIILVESFVLALPPRAILERHHDRFADVPEIYRLKRNLLHRLERSRDLRQLHI